MNNIQNQSGVKPAISFPVGGIGAGCIGLAGNGNLAEWEIFNRPAKGVRNEYSHFAVRAEKNGKVISAKVLQGDSTVNYCGTFAGPSDGFGTFGFSAETFGMGGFPHFRNCHFDGFFPIADIALSDPDFPAEARLHAWSPFVPGDSDTASLPCACFEITLRNTSDETMDFSCAGILCNPWSNAGASDRIVRKDGLTQLILDSGLDGNDIKSGSLALSTDAENVSFQEYFYRGSGQDYFEVYWHDWTTPGPVVPRSLPVRTGKEERKDAGLVAAHFTLEPGQERTVRFIISWFIPNCENYWDKGIGAVLEKNGLKENRWKNYYAKLCGSAADAAEKLFAKYDAVSKKVLAFRDAMRSSTLPEAPLDGASACLAVLVSPTSLRLENGTFWGWEGTGPTSGSCAGTCQHVWNYAQALPLLFPDLERSIRKMQAAYGFRENGAWCFRQGLPEGIHADEKSGPGCVDGTFGEVLKIYREWKISGDTEWLRSIWFAVRKAFNYAWDPESSDKWDPQKTGFITGRQHNTLDIELFGPVGWLEGIYLAALKAASEMADVLGEKDFSRECLDLFRNGRKRMENELFNGEYYIQKVDFHDPAYALQFLRPGETAETFFYLDREHDQIKYQYGEGCEIDSHLGAWFAALYGVGEILDPAQVHSTLNSIVRYNYCPNVRFKANTWRVYSINDEAGTSMCVWPEGKEKPVIALTYGPETMTGFEWAAASHLVMCGEVENGTMLAKAIRDRYDGVKRNPWNEIECGSNYARSMAAFSMFQAFSGFSYDMVRGRIGFRPAVSGDFRCFWSIGTAWGEYERTGNTQTVRILSGSMTLNGIAIPANTCERLGKRIADSMTDDEFRFEKPCVLAEGDELVFRP